MLNQEVRFCTARDGVRIAYALSGAGPPLVLPATWLTHLQMDPVLLGFRHWLEGLSRHHTLVRADLRGSGLSDWDIPSMEFEDWVGDLEAMVDDAGLDRFPLFGLSHGTATAIAYAARHPERVSHLVLFAASDSGWWCKLPDEGRARWPAYVEFVRTFWWAGTPRTQRFLTDGVVQAAPREVVMALNEARKAAMNPENAVSAMETMARVDVTHLLPQISAPTLVLQPRRGSPVDIPTARRVAAAIPNARLVLLEADNHLIQEYEPGWPALLDETWRFLGVNLEAASSVAGSPNGQHGPEPGLSAREQEVLALVARHRTNAEIAEALTISPTTASKHVHNILGKLGVNRRSEAAAWWAANGNAHE